MDIQPSYTTHLSPHYHPFGMLMPNRHENSSQYRYSFNTQEKVDEISGEGNHTTALYWEYDTRLGRRWNQDPKPNPMISNYATFANNPIRFSDILGDTINTTERFENDPDAMARYNKWSESKAGRKFHKRYGIGGKYEEVSITIDLYTYEEQNSYKKGYEGFTQSFAVNGNNFRELNLGDNLNYGEYLKFRIALNPTTNTWSSNNPFNIVEGGETILHETQHLRIIHYGFLMTNSYKYDRYQQHRLMRTNLFKGHSFIDDHGNSYYLQPNNIYDFRAERWQYYDEFRSEEDMDSKIDERAQNFMD